VEGSIISLVEHLLRDVTCPPTDLDMVMRRCNIVNCELDHDLVVPGEIRQTSDGLKIYLTPGLSTGRERFTVAHEVGHAIFESTGQRCPRRGEELERLCDKIATELLMPTGIFKKYAGPNPTLDRVIELCDLFQTSIAATLRRVPELYRVRTFEVRDGTTTSKISNIWLAGASPTFHESILRAMNGESGKEAIEFYTNTGYTRWNMEWRCLRQRKHALFMLTPY